MWSLAVGRGPEARRQGEPPSRRLLIRAEFLETSIGKPEACGILGILRHLAAQSSAGAKPGRRSSLEGGHVTFRRPIGSGPQKSPTPAVRNSGSFVFLTPSPPSSDKGA